MTAAKSLTAEEIVYHRFILWLLIDPTNGVIRFATDKERGPIEAVAELHRLTLSGQKVTRKSWAAARDAAMDAAMDAARDAARDAAWTAALAAAWDVAWAAAWAAARKRQNEFLDGLYAELGIRDYRLELA